MSKKVKGFEDFNIEVEKERLQKIKRSFKPNSDQQQYTTNTRNEFDETTRKITTVTKDEVVDDLKSLEETNEGISGDISKLIKRKLDGENLSQKDFLKLHNWMMENDNDYCKSFDKQMSKDLKKLVPKNTEIKNEGHYPHFGTNSIFYDRDNDSEEITRKEKEICLKVYEKYRFEMEFYDLEMSFIDWLKK